MSAIETTEMQVVDSCGWITYREDGPHADEFESLILDTTHLIVPTIVFFEVFKYFKREYSDNDACEMGFAMKEGRLIPIDHVLVFQAADLSLEHKLPMGDALILAVARAYRATLHTMDSHLKGLEGVRFVA